MRAEIRVFILQALRAAGGQPMSEPAVVAAVQAAFPEALVSTVREVLRMLERDGFVAAVEDELTGLVNYGLTQKGEMRAAQL
jgi:Fe2+ or Zn2+ uptake regulation protein